MQLLCCYVPSSQEVDSDKGGPFHQVCTCNKNSLIRQMPPLLPKGLVAGVKLPS